MKLVIIFCVLAMLFSQNLIIGQKNEIPVLNILECSDKRELKLSDLVSKTRLVKLETNDSSLIESTSRYLVGTKYIICINQSNSFGKGNILQFDSNGKFIRVLAKQGRGPEEFTSISGIDMDREELNLFFTSSPSKMIQVVDLKTGKFGSPIPISNGESAPGIIIKSNKICILPRITGNEKYILYYQDFSGKFIEGIPVTYKNIPQLNLGLVSSPVSQGDFIHYYDPKVSGDTLFKVNGVKKSPVAIVRGGNNFGSSMESPTGYATTLLTKTADFWMFSNLLIEMNNNILNLNPDNTHIYTLDSENSRLFEINEFTLDKYGKTYTKSLPLNSFDLTRGQFILKIESTDFKKIVAENKFTLPENEMKEIKKLDQEVTIYDNPILLIGKLK